MGPAASARRGHHARGGLRGTFDRHYDLAHTLIASSQSLAALDVEREPTAVRRRYGSHRFGQCCLIARRLVEAGQPFVQVNWSTHVEAIEDSGDGGWDMHDRYFAIMQDQHGWMFDRALSALIEDLDQRSCSTRRWLSRWASSAARRRSTTGRAANIILSATRRCWPAAGVQGGRVVGTSDKRAERPADRHFSPADLGATIFARLGIGAADLTGINLAPMARSSKSYSERGRLSGNPLLGDPLHDLAERVDLLERRIDVGRDPETLKVLVNDRGDQDAVLVQQVSA